MNFNNLLLVIHWTIDYDHFMRVYRKFTKSFINRNNAGLFEGINFWEEGVNWTPSHNSRRTNPISI